MEFVNNQMELRNLRIFQREVEGQCTFAVIAWADLAQALDTSNMDRIWYSIQSFLVAAGNISKILWPPSPKVKKLEGESGENFKKRFESRKVMTEERGK